MQDSQPIIAQLLRIEGLDVSGLAVYKVSESKVFTTNSTNMLGAIRRTLIGTRTVLDTQLTIANRGTLTAIIAKLKLDSFDVTYFDTRDNALRTAAFVADGWDTELLFKDRGLFEPFTITLTSLAVR